MIVKSPMGEGEVTVYPSQVLTFEDFLRRRGYKIKQVDALDRFVVVDKPFHSVIEKKNWRGFIEPNYEFREFLESIGI
jgi:hypothetical protein